MEIKINALFLVLMMTASILLSACGSVLYTEPVFENGVLTVSGKGPLGSQETTYDQPITKIIIENGITSIEDEAFRDLEALTEVDIPKSVESVGAYAFLGCTSLARVNIDNYENEVTFGKGAFPEGVEIVWIRTAAMMDSLSAADSTSDVTEADSTAEETTGAADETTGEAQTDAEVTTEAETTAEVTTAAPETTSKPETTAAPHSHSYTNPTVTKAATHTSEGERTSYCSCGATKTETIAKTAEHSFTSSKITKEATVSEEGVKTYYCACGATRTESIAKLPAPHTHNFENPKVTTAATHMSDGVRTYTCSCGGTKTEAISKTAEHTFENPKVTKEATHTEEGVRTYNCACGETKTETIAKTAEHDYTDYKVTKEASLTQNGAVTYYCVCGATKDEPIIKLEAAKSVKVGNIIEIGSYEQDNNTANGKEAIQWRVLEVKDGEALVISLYGLENRAFNVNTQSIWDTSSTRSWLNNYFLKNAFSEDEKECITLHTVSNPRNPIHGNYSGPSTSDSIFLLSVEEAEKYFSSNSDRAAKPTEYAIAKGAFVSRSNGFTFWWLRTTGSLARYCTNVGSSGNINHTGLDCLTSTYTVRPAMWVKTDA